MIERREWVSPLYKFGNGFIDLREVIVLDYYEKSEGGWTLYLKNEDGKSLASFSHDTRGEAARDCDIITELKENYERSVASDRK